MRLEEANIRRVSVDLDIGYGKAIPCRFYEQDGVIGASVSLATSMVVPLSLQNWYKKNSESKINKRKEETAGTGTKLHAIIEADAQGGEVVVPEGAEVWAEQWDAAKKQYDITADYSEVMVFSKEHAFGGQVDRIGNFAGKRSLIDLKTGNYSVMDLWKTEAYRQAYKEMTGEEVETVVLYIPRPDLQERGKKVTHYTIKNHDSCFLSFLAAYRVFRMTYYKQLIEAGMRKEDVFK